MFAQRVLAECKILNPIVLLKSGRECLNYFLSIAADDAPGLVLVDLVMPHPNGVEVCRELCNSPRGAHTIFVMLSGLADIKLIQQGYQHGARTFLVKPLIREDFLRLLDGLKGVEIEPQVDGYVLSFPQRGKMKYPPGRPESDTRSISLSF